jgi:hypothetical protein
MVSECECTNQSDVNEQEALKSMTQLEHTAGHVALVMVHGVTAANVDRGPIDIDGDDGINIIHRKAMTTDVSVTVVPTTV